MHLATAGGRGITALDSDGDGAIQSLHRLFDLEGGGGGHSATKSLIVAYLVDRPRNAPRTHRLPLAHVKSRTMS